MTPLERRRRLAAHLAAQFAHGPNGRLLKQYRNERRDTMNGLHCAFVGRVGTEPEPKYTSGGTALCSFSVAVAENRAGGDGAETTWVRVTAWEELAEQLAETLRKGADVYVEGKLRLNVWQGQDGQQRSGLNCSAWTVQPLGAIGRRAPKRATSERDQESA